MKKPWWMLPVCWLGMCPHFTNSDDTGVWGECATCGNRAGFVTREQLRRYAERMTPTALPQERATPTASPGPSDATAIRPPTDTPPTTTTTGE